MMAKKRSEGASTHGDVLADSRGGEEKLAISAPVLLDVLDADGLEALAAGGVGLVHGEDSTALGGDGALRGEKAKDQRHVAGGRSDRHSAVKYA
jgi:hypothetical protein